MNWFIGRSEALSNPQAARRKALERLQGLAALDDPESLVVPILLDAILMAESYRGARHQISFLPELTRSVDALLRELTILEKANSWAEEPMAGAAGKGWGQPATPAPGVSIFSSRRPLSAARSMTTPA